MTIPPADEEALACTLQRARAVPMRRLTQRRDALVSDMKLCRRARNVIAAGAAASFVGLVVAPEFWGTVTWAVIAFFAVCIAFFSVAAAFDGSDLVHVQREIDTFDPGSVVTVSSWLDDSGTDIVRTVMVGAMRWEERFRLDRDGEGSAAQIARHRVADERLRSSLEAGRLPEATAVEARRRLEAIALLGAEMPSELPSRRAQSPVATLER